jgi:intracellular sulfur oxidation DsrE/DsrF family protein
MTSKFNLFTGFLFIVCLGFFMSATSTESAIVTSQPSKKQEIVFFIETSDLAGLKQGLVDINLHLRKEGRPHNQPVKVVIHGSGVRFFKKVGFDSELEYMLRWFQDEQIFVSLCAGCLIEHGVDKDSLVAGLQLWQSRIPIVP